MDLEDTAPLVYRNFLCEQGFLIRAGLEKWEPTKKLIDLIEEDSKYLILGGILYHTNVESKVAFVQSGLYTQFDDLKKFSEAYTSWVEFIVSRPGGVSRAGIGVPTWKVNVETYWALQSHFQPPSPSEVTTMHERLIVIDYTLPDYFIGLDNFDYAATGLTKPPRWWRYKYPLRGLSLK